MGVVGGYHDEPGPDFVDVEGEAELESMRWERGLSASDNQRSMARKTTPLGNLPGAS